MSVKVDSEITIIIDDRKLRMTGVEAKLLFIELGKELNLNIDNSCKKIDSPPKQR